MENINNEAVVLSPSEKSFNFLLEKYREDPKTYQNYKFVFSEREIRELILDTAIACALSPSFFKELTHDSELKKEK